MSATGSLIHPVARSLRRAWGLPWPLRLLAALLLLFALLALVLFLSRDWLTSMAVDTLKARLNKHGVYIRVDSTGFSPIRGIVFTDVTAYSDPEKTTPLLSFSDLAVAVNPFRRGEKEDLSARFTTDAATFMTHRPNEAISLSQVELTLYATRNRIHISKLEAQGAGTALDLSADIALGPGESSEKTDPQPATPAGKGALDDLNLKPVAQLLAALATQPRGAAPEVQAHLDFPAAGPPTVKGSISGRDFTWRGTALDSLDLEIAITPVSEIPSGAATIQTIAFPTLDLVYRGKSLRASGAYHLASQTVTLTSFTSGIDLFAFFADLFPNLSNTFTGFRMATPPEVIFSGTIPIPNPHECALEGTVANGAFGIQTEEGRELLISETSCSFTLAGGKLNPPDLTASLFGGAATGAIELLPFESPVRFTGKLALAGASLKQITSHIGTASFGSGRIDLTFNGSGGPTLPSLDGSGHLRLSGADSVSLPILTSLLTTIRTVIPLLKTGDNSTTVTANYTLRDGVFTSNNIKLESGALAVDGTTRVNIEKSYLHATASTRTTGATGLVTGLAGKALALEGEGPLGAVQWRLKNLPVGAGTAAGAVIDGAKDVGGAVGETAGGLLKGIKGILTKSGKK